MTTSAVTSPSDSTDIAIIGMVCRLPGARDLHEFTRNLYDGVESITQFSEAELLAAGVSAARLRDPRYVRAKGIVHGIENFDHEFFGIGKDQADLMDPQHRVFLEASWQLMENAGHDPERFDGRIGVYAGTALNTYVLNNLRHVDARYERFNPIDLLIFTDKDFLPTLVSYHLGLEGPSVAVQTACSTSLVAVHLACQGLIDAECDIAIAGAITLYSPQVKGYLYEPGNLVSPDGRIRSYAAGASGTVYGSGYGLVALRRFADAVRDGDTIHAVIQGTAVNNDGGRKATYKSPSEDGIAEVAGMALAMAGVEPREIGYLEGNGSGTALGDRIEIAALSRAYRRSERDPKTFIGSVKPNIGHLNVAAGMAALLKTVVALQHDDIPPSLNCPEPEPSVDWSAAPLRVARSRVRWPDVGPTRMAGVNSYGVGGTNAHVILREPPRLPPRPDRDERAHVFPFSAKTAASLSRSLVDFRRFVTANAELDLGDVAYTLQVGRRDFAWRRAVVAADRDELRAALAAPWSARAPAAGSAVEFVFPDPCPKRTMAWARRLAAAEPEFVRAWREWLARASTEHADAAHLEPSVLERADSADAPGAADGAVFAALCTMAHLWTSLGIRPAHARGDGVGGLVADCLVGRRTIRDAVEHLAGRPTAPSPSSSPPDACGTPGIVLRFEPGHALPAGSEPRPGDRPIPGMPGAEATLARWFAGSLASVWERGGAVAWSRTHAPGLRRRVPLPTYSFEPTRCWVDIPRDAGPSSLDAAR